MDAAGVQHDDGDRHDLLQFVDDLRKRDELLLGGVERREVGVDRHEIVLAAGLDAVAGIVDDRDVGAFGVLDEALQRPAQPARIAIGHHVGLEAELVEQFLDGPRIVGRIGQRCDVLVVAIADDQRDAPQRLGLLGPRGAEDQQQAEAASSVRIIMPALATPLRNPSPPAPVPPHPLQAAMARGWRGVVLCSEHVQHDLADVVAFLHPLMRAPGFLERKDHVDHRRDPALGKQRPDLCLERRRDLCP